MLDSPGRAVALHRMVDRLQAGTCPDWFTAIIGRTWERAVYWPLSQVAAFTSGSGWAFAGFAVGALRQPPC
ncbi:hypothetical protein ACWDDN_04260 [Streptomyces griseoruber]|uniref:Uncharacterized protein n=1 Tax=Streptomyces griseoruber TaxID=1943 RepID=A0A101T6L5_9ACTN|nr:hypothetical protein AQJ64_05375 [Streptomyces griseoruber]